MIDDRTLEMLDDLRSIGNSAAHSTAATEATIEEAMRYRALVATAAAILT
jgi:hypothetical protein